MICKYETRLVAACPVDDRPDVYEMLFESAETIQVEDIIAELSPYMGRKVFQEDITSELARKLKCKVTSVGWHSGIKTTVIAP